MTYNAKKLICALLALAICFAFSACGTTNNGSATGTAPNSTAGSNQSTQAAAGTTALPVEGTTAATQAVTEPSHTSSTEATDPRHTHFYRTVTHEATCSAGGYVEYICDCGKTYIANQTNPSSHDYSTQVTSPSDGAQGYTLYTCKVCGHSYKDNYTWGNTNTDAGFFDDAAFIGDSVTLALRNLCMTSGDLGKATFLCVGSYSVNNAVTNGLFLTYQGQQMTPQDALAACGAKKVFIMLGMNDIALFGDRSIDIAMDNWSTMLARIREKTPGIQIYIQSATPIYTAGQKGSLNNARMDQYNARLQTFAQENGCYYIDIASHMKDSTGGLAAQYCSDQYVHLTVEGCKLWINILKSSI